MKVIDLTHTLCEKMPVYPGTEAPFFLPANTYETDGFRETKLCMYSHTGTHIDPPAHLFPDTKTLDQYPVNHFAGKALVIDCRSFSEGETVPKEHLLSYGDLVEKADFLLFCFGWDSKWGSKAYFGNYPCLSLELIDYILEGNFKGIGLDSISLDPISDCDLIRHRKLLGNSEMINIENLCNLHLCTGCLFDFCCLPIKILDSDGAPCRAIAILENEASERIVYGF